MSPCLTLLVPGTATEPAGHQRDAALEQTRHLEAELLAAWDQAIEQQRLRGSREIEAALALFDETPRWQRAELALVADKSGLITQLRETHDVEVYAGQGAETVPLLSTAQVDEQLTVPWRDASSFAPFTDLSSGLSAAEQAVAADNSSDVVVDGEPPARTAIVLLSDGQQNFGPSPLETARVLAGQGTPLYTVATGSIRSANDLAVVSLEYPERAFRKDRVRGVMIIRDQATAGQPLLAQIKSGDIVLWQQTLLTQGTGQRRIEFDFPIESEVDRLDAGPAGITQHVLPISLQASVAPLPNESETSNNEQTMRLGVIAQGYKVLLMDGRSRWETRYLRNVFERDDRWEVNTIIAGPATDNLTIPRGDADGQFPANRESLFEYDLVVMGEVSAELLAEHEYEWLESFVAERGGGVVFIDGQRGKLRTMGAAALTTLLPVRWLSEPQTSPVTLLDLTPAGTSEASLRLESDEAKNRRFWTELPPPRQLVKVEALPGSRVLVEADVNGTRYPAIVTRQVGAGQVLYLAFDETWRWRYKSADAWHQRIWNQLAVRVMPPPFTASNDYLAIDTGPIAYRAGDSAPIRVRLSDTEGKPDAGATVEALVWKQGQLESTISLSPDPNVPGVYRSQTDRLEPGEYEVTIRASGYSEQAMQVATEFVVLADESGEMIQTNVNESLLKQMAQESGGRYLREEALGELPELLSPLSSGRVVVTETMIWQSYGWFAAVILLLAIEWLLRKKAGLL